MKKILLIEPDRVFSSKISAYLQDFGYIVNIASGADEAMVLLEADSPDLIILELALPSHSGTEFLYEFRSYQDWQNIAIVIYSSIKIDQKVLSSDDWNLLNVADVLYKTENSLPNLLKGIKKVI